MGDGDPERGALTQSHTVLWQRTRKPRWHGRRVPPQFEVWWRGRRCGGAADDRGGAAGRGGAVIGRAAAVALSICPRPSCSVSPLTPCAGARCHARLGLQESPARHGFLEGFAVQPEGAEIHKCAVLACARMASRNHAHDGTTVPARRRRSEAGAAELFSGRDSCMKQSVRSARRRGRAGGERRGEDTRGDTLAG